MLHGINVPPVTLQLIELWILYRVDVCVKIFIISKWGLNLCVSNVQTISLIVMFVIIRAFVSPAILAIMLNLQELELINVTNAPLLVYNALVTLATARIAMLVENLI